MARSLLHIHIYVSLFKGGDKVKTTASALRISIFFGVILTSFIPGSILKRIIRNSNLYEPGMDRQSVVDSI